MARPSKPGKTPTRRKTSTASTDAATTQKPVPSETAFSASAQSPEATKPDENAAPEKSAATIAQEAPAVQKPADAQINLSEPATPAEQPEPTGADAAQDSAAASKPDAPSEEFAAVVVDSETSPEKTDMPQSDTTTDATPETDASADTTDTRETDGTPINTSAPDADGTSVDGKNDVAEPEGSPDTPATKHDQTPPPASPPPPPNAQSGFFPLVLGGVIAAGIGFGVSQFVGPMGTTTAELSSDVADLEGRVTLMSGELSTQINDMSTSAADDTLGTVLPMIDSLTDRLDEQDARLTALSEDDDTEDQIAEAMAGLESRVSEQVAATLSEPLADLSALRDDISARQEGLRADIESLRALAETRLAEAEADVADAADRAARTAARLALGDIAAAFDSGAPFAAALDDITAAGIDIPAPLSDVAQTGVPTLVELQERYTDAARRALGASLTSVETGSVTDRVALFLRSQTNARSLSAREGDDPDAILSRAEAALRAGRVANAIDELDALPDDGRAAMVDWIELAQLRADAAEGLTTLQNQLTAE